MTGTVELGQDSLKDFMDEDLFYAGAKKDQEDARRTVQQATAGVDHIAEAATKASLTLTAKQKLQRAVSKVKAVNRVGASRPHSPQLPEPPSPLSQFSETETKINFDYPSLDRLKSSNARASLTFSQSKAPDYHGKEPDLPIDVNESLSDKSEELQKLTMKDVSASIRKNLNSPLFRSQSVELRYSVPLTSSTDESPPGSPSSSSRSSSKSSLSTTRSSEEFILKLVRTPRRKADLGSDGLVLEELRAACKEFEEKLQGFSGDESELKQLRKNDVNANGLIFVRERNGPNKGLVRFFVVDERLGHEKAGQKYPRYMSRDGSKVFDYKGTKITNVEKIFGPRCDDIESDPSKESNQVVFSGSTRHIHSQPETLELIESRSHKGVETWTTSLLKVHLMPVEDIYYWINEKSLSKDSHNSQPKMHIVQSKEEIPFHKNNEDVKFKRKSGIRWELEGYTQFNPLEDPKEQMEASLLNGLADMKEAVRRNVPLASLVLSKKEKRPDERIPGDLVFTHSSPASELYSELLKCENFMRDGITRASRLGEILYKYALDLDGFSQDMNNGNNGKVCKTCTVTQTVEDSLKVNAQICNIAWGRIKRTFGGAKSFVGKKIHDFWEKKVNVIEIIY